MGQIVQYGNMKYNRKRELCWID